MQSVLFLTILVYGCVWASAPLIGRRWSSWRSQRKQQRQWNAYAHRALLVRLAWEARAQHLALHCAGFRLERQPYDWEQGL